MKDIVDTVTLYVKMGSPIHWKTSILGKFLSVKNHSVIGFIDFTPCLETSPILLSLHQNRNPKQRTYSSGTCAMEYYSCSHMLLRTEMP